MSIDVRLQNVLKNLVDGDYVDKFDALSLSAIEIDDIQDVPAAIPPELVVGGLRRLTDDVIKILTAESIAEQSALTRISSELLHCDNEAQRIVVDDYVNKSETWFSVAEAGGAQDKLKELNRDRSTLRNMLQDIHDEVTAIVYKKIYAYDKVHEIYEYYLISLAELATSVGIRYPSKRSNLVVAQQLNIVERNRFFSSDEVNFWCCNLLIIIDLLPSLPGQQNAEQSRRDER